ncbi:efflux pump antibiotic resistance protein [Penicillium maclennaniae]|uniref:efflux pump antibiotic resistance protein n=1 Tax=Penicillium maclennaniae TaxID=1343394 RepID=UPI0025412A0C|nr:efflux pump antibiotic resistance protein [Penicillium maclennaniae]KAJ5678209.1 efflux pump antibiotic resistance protein [Penicillium maclennaniae]
MPRMSGVLITSRFFAGFGASVVNALAKGVLADVWRPKQRGCSLGVYLLIPLLGAAVGPIIGRFMAERTTWRWMFWSTSIFQAVMVVVSFFSFWETHEPLILRGRAERIEKTREIRETIPQMSLAIRIQGRALIRPVRLLTFHQIIQIASVISVFSYSILYIVLSTLSDLWTQHYQESIEISGLHYIAAALGDIASSQICAKLMDSLFHRLKARANGEHSPELRTPAIFPDALLVPLGLFFYGWAATYRLH